MTTKNTSLAPALDIVFNALYSLYWKTHTSHWNIKAPDFYSLHEMFESQYTFLWNTLDEVAERYRVFDLPAPIKSINVDGKLSLLPRDELLKALLKENQSAMKTITECIEVFDDLDDMTTEDFLIGLLATLEKHSWMIRASIGDSGANGTR